MNKSEEWETRKKKEITTTRQIETRVKRQVVLEDGEVIVDSGPLVTTNTTEDVEQQEHTTEERRTIGDDPTQAGGKWPATRSSSSPGGKCTLRINNSVLHGNPEDASIVQEELNETVVRSREEIEERLETEDRQQLGDISDEAYQKAVHSNRGDLRTALAESTKQLLAGAQSGPRVVQHTTRSSKVVDTEKTLERKELKADGLIVTERKRTVEHEEIKDDPVPEEEAALNDGKDDVLETKKESSQRFIKKRDEDLVDYISGGERVAREMRYVAETTEGERIGDWPASSSPTTMRKTRSRTTNARKEALTKEPLDLEEEDEARKFETSRWLENHFGSEFKSSYSSIDTEITPHPPNTTNTSYINVTMKSSCPPKERDYQNLHSNRHQVKQHQYGSTTVTKATIPEYSSPASPSGYFHGISEWSERYNNRENQNTNTRTGSSSSRYVDSPQYNDRGHTDVDEGKQNHVKSPNSYENINRNGYHDHSQERQCTPSPPIRRKSREKKRFLIPEDQGNANEQEILARGASPINVIQRTWETRSRDVSKEQSTERDVQKPTRCSRSRSNSPKPTSPPSSSASSKLILRDENNKSPPDPPVKTRPTKSTSGQSKYKIGESFRKLVGKLRSSSLERKNKRSHVNSISQLTQTDDNEPTYLQYNVIDRNVPLVNDNRNRINENESSLNTLPRNITNGSNKTIKTTITKTMVERDCKEEWQHEHRSPTHRYHPNENATSTRHSRSRAFGASDAITSPMESNSLGRISKSTSRLTPDYGREEHFRSTQTLPRNLNAGGRQQHFEQERNVQTCQRGYQSTGTHSIPIRQENTLHSTSSSSSNQDRHYSSMINISIKNAVTSPSSRLINIQTTGLRVPEKPERTYKSSLSRSKSFNVEANKNISSHVPFTSNSQLNRLDTAPPPLKSPGILASISRSNRDLFRENKREY